MGGSFVHHALRASVCPRLLTPWIIARLDRKLTSRGLISNCRLAGSCFKMALTGSIIVEICDETMAKMCMAQTSRNVGFVYLHVVLFRSF